MVNFITNGNSQASNKNKWLERDLQLDLVSYLLSKTSYRDLIGLE